MILFSFSGSDCFLISKDIDLSFTLTVVPDTIIGADDDASNLNNLPQYVHSVL